MTDGSDIVRLQPAGWAAPPIPISPGVAGAGLVFVSGQVATDENGAILIGDFDAEVNRTLGNVEAVLAEAGLGWADVLKVSAYLSSALLFGPFNELYAARLGDIRPARTTTVTSFGNSDVRVEIDVIARARS